MTTKITFDSSKNWTIIPQDLKKGLMIMRDKQTIPIYKKYDENLINEIKKFGYFDPTKSVQLTDGTLEEAAGYFVVKGNVYEFKLVTYEDILNGYLLFNFIYDMYIYFYLRKFVKN